MNLNDIETCKLRNELARRGIIDTDILEEQDLEKFRLFLYSNARFSQMYKSARIMKWKYKDFLEESLLDTLGEIKRLEQIVLNNYERTPYYIVDSRKTTVGPDFILTDEATKEIQKKQEKTKINFLESMLNYIKNKT